MLNEPLPPFLVSYLWKMSALKCLLAKDKRTNFVFLMGTCQAERSFPTDRPTLKNYGSLKGETDRLCDSSSSFMNRLSGCCDAQTCLPALSALSSCEPFLHLIKQPQNTLKPPKKHAGDLHNTHSFLKFKSQTLSVSLLSEVSLISGFKCNF